MKQIDGLKVAAVLLLWLSCSLNNPFLENSNQGSDRSDYLSPKIGRLIYVPEGKFRRHNWSSGVTAISRGYRMSQYEITREQFSAVMGADPSDPSKSSGPNDPVQNVSWYQAIAFCNQLSFAEGLTPVYEVPGVNFATLPYADIPTENSASWNSAVVTAGSNGYRLPTEMEWQWAAMGADQDSTGVFDDGVNMTGLQKKFAGDDGSALLGDYTVFGYPASPKFLGETNTERTNQVGSRLPNELGFFDLSGNVWEWTFDWYGVVPDGSLSDYQGQPTGTYRVFKGASWYNIAGLCFFYNRFSCSYAPFETIYNIGFRVVRD